MRMRLTHDLPGTGGEPAQVRCHEVLGREPNGDGKHRWVLVGKSGLSSAQARAALARAAGIPEERVAWAGARAREHAVEQWFSIAEEDLVSPRALDRAGAHGRMRVLRTVAASRPMAADQVARLRWQVRLKGGNRNGGFIKARAICDRLRRGGLPNWAPRSQFGTGGSFARWGRTLLRGRPLPGAARGVDAGRLLRAVQLSLFDHWLSARVADGLLGAVVAGDLVRTLRGTDELVADPTPWRGRLDAFEVAPLGPLFGAGMAPAAADALAREQAVLAAADLDDAAVARLRGDRRTARVQPQRVRIDPAGDDLELSAELPAETDLDALLDEVVKPEQVVADDDPEG